MATPKFDRDLAVRAVVDAALLGDKAATERHGISGPTLSRYRTRLKDDPEVKKAVSEKKAMADKAWLSELPESLGACSRYILRAAQSKDQTPEMIHAIAGALKILAETWFASQVLDARLSRNANPGGNVVPIGERRKAANE